MEEEDEFEIECMALEAIFCDSFRREDGRRICVTVEPMTPEGETLREWIFSLILDVPQKCDTEAMDVRQRWCAWLCSYPEELPIFTVSALENIVYSAQAKKELAACLEREAEGMKGEQMVYNLVEWLKENLMHYVELSKRESGQDDLSQSEKARPSESTSKSEPRKEKMTKAQKRRFYSRFGAVDEKPRGWNWVDIIAHLSSRPQT